VVRVVTDDIAVLLLLLLPVVDLLCYLYGDLCY
jgi:hypothetical protein